MSTEYTFDGLNEWEKKYDLHIQHVNISNNEDALKKIADGEIDGLYR